MTMYVFTLHLTPNVLNKWWQHTQNTIIIILIEIIIVIKYYAKMIESTTEK